MDHYAFIKLNDSEKGELYALTPPDCVTTLNPRRPGLPKVAIRFFPSSGKITIGGEISCDLWDRVLDSWEDVNIRSEAQSKWGRDKGGKEETSSTSLSLLMNKLQREPYPHDFRTARAVISQLAFSLDFRPIQCIHVPESRWMLFRESTIFEESINGDVILCNRDVGPSFTSMYQIRDPDKVAVVLQFSSAPRYVRFHFNDNSGGVSRNLWRNSGWGDLDDLDTWEFRDFQPLYNALYQFVKENKAPTDTHEVFEMLYPVISSYLGYSYYYNSVSGVWELDSKREDLSRTDFDESLSLTQLAESLYKFSSSTEV